MVYAVKAHSIAVTISLPIKHPAQPQQTHYTIYCPTSCCLQCELHNKNLPAKSIISSIKVVDIHPPDKETLNTIRHLGIKNIPVLVPIPIRHAKRNIGLLANFQPTPLYKKFHLLQRKLLKNLSS